MKKLIYIQDNFLDSTLCQPFIDLFSVKKEDRSLDAVTHSDPNETLTYMPEFKFDKNYDDLITALRKDQHSEEEYLNTQKAFIKYNDRQDLFRGVKKTWRDLLPDLEASIEKSITK